jgi:hypothetical protein
MPGRYDFDGIACASWQVGTALVPCPDIVALADALDNEQAADRRRNAWAWYRV